MTEHLVDIVDDDPGTQKLLRVIARNAGCRTRGHTTADAALAAMRLDPPALAVVDVQLPGAWDGLTLVRAMRATPGIADLPIVVVSAFASLADEARARAAGCDLWMPKPIEVHAFADVLRVLLGGPDAGVEGNA